MIENPGFPKRDRLAAFFATFELTARVVPPDASAGANLVVLGRDGAADRIVFRACGEGTAGSGHPVLAAAVIAFGGLTNPLMSALPESLEVTLAEVPLLGALVEAFVAEASTDRCGRQVALDRLCEVIVLLLLRQAIDRGATGRGLLAGLSHAALHRALVAMHDDAARRWRVEELAEIAGLSRSRFMEQFRETVGTTPAAYLTGWRLTLAQRELQRGGRVKSVARRVGFGSAAAFSRAYSRAFGRPPVSAREAAVAQSVLA